MGEVVQRYGAALSRTHRAPSRLSRWSSPAMGEVARGGRSGFFLSHACYATPFRRERSERWLPALAALAAKRARRDATAAVSAEFHPLLTVLSRLARHDGVRGRVPNSGEACRGEVFGRLGGRRLGGGRPVDMGRAGPGAGRGRRGRERGGRFVQQRGRRG